MATIPCPTCGHPNHDTARFCEECATPLAATPPPVTPPAGQPAVPGQPPATGQAPAAGQPMGYPSGAPMPSAAGRSPDAVRNALIAAVVVLVGVAVVLVVLVARGDGDDGDDEAFDDVSATSTTTTTTTTTSSTTTTTTTTTTPPPPDEGGGLFGLPSGLFCRDLAARGYSYADSVAYWESEGRPDRMDADLNGYPCETVYPSSEVIAYWGFDPQGGGGGGGVAGLPSGLFCRDLAARGYSYADSVAYWELEGRPDRMDADLNGYPCETVYPAGDVIAYWGFDPP